MADFEGKVEMNDDKTEGEVKGKFKLTEEELDNVAGGCGDDDNTPAPKYYVDQYLYQCSSDITLVYKIKERDYWNDAAWHYHLSKVTTSGWVDAGWKTEAELDSNYTT